MEAVSYVLDASVFIEAARRYYAFDLAPTFVNYPGLKTGVSLPYLDEVIG